MSIWIILFIALVVAYFVITEGAKKYFDIKVQVLFTAGMYQQCIDLLDRKLARIVMSTFKQYYLRFTIYEADNNVMAAERMLEHLLNMSCGKKQRLQLVARAFNFYVMAGHRKQAAAMLEEMRTTAPKELVADSQLTYDIVFCHRHDKIKEMEAMLGTDDPNLRAKLYMLLAYQHASAGHKENARRYRALGKKLKESQMPPKPKAQQDNQK